MQNLVAIRFIFIFSFYKKKLRHSPIDADAGDMAEGNKPTELHIMEEVIKVNSWQEVFIKFLKYLRDSPDFDFEFILDTQSELFRRKETILKWSTLKDLIDNNVDLSSRYKTFDGKVRIR